MTDTPNEPQPQHELPSLEPPRLSPPPVYPSRPPAASNDLAITLDKEQTPPSLYAAVLFGSLLCGLVANFLFGNANGIGFNLPLWFSVFAATFLFIARGRTIPVWRKACLGAAAVFALCMAIRSSVILRTVDGLLIAVFASLACTSSNTRFIKGWWAVFIDHVQLVFNGLFGCLFLLVETPWKSLHLDRHKFGVTIRILIGCLIAFPFLLVFGLLFARAETRFLEFFSTLYQYIVQLALFHFWLIAIVTYLVAGGLRNAFISASLTGGRYSVIRDKSLLGIVESSTVLSLLNAMFLLFVLTQLPYFFGGQHNVDSTPDLVWSEYARKGFFELACVTALLIPTLTFFTTQTRTTTRRHTLLLRFLCGGLSLLAGIIIASALQRMVLYTINYGLTEMRIYVSVFIAMLAIILLLLNLFSITGRNRWFLPAVLIVGFVFAAGIHVPNIQGMITRDVVSRKLANKPHDFNYLKQLSPDAVPALAQSDLSASEKSDIINAIMGRQQPYRSGRALLDESFALLRARAWASEFPPAPSPSSESNDSETTKVDR